MVTKRELLEDAASREPGNEVSLTIRNFIALWGAKRRGYWYVRQIREDLKRFDIVTKPSFEDGWIDNTIILIPNRTPSVSADAAALVESTSTPSESQETSSTLMAGALTFADLQHTIFGSNPPALVSVQPSDTLAKAQSLMMRHDFSQLPVISGERNLKGAVSWESMAKSLAHKPGGAETFLIDCIIPADLLALSDDVLTNIPKITKNGFVVTKDHTNRVIGVITTSDLSLAFQGLAGPFLLLGIAERLLRSVAEAEFSDDKIRSAIEGEVTTDRAVDSLTFGALQGLFASREQWAELNLTVDRKVFLEMLEEVRLFRNEVMHFRNDFSSSSKIQTVENMISWLRYLTA